jgi:hypothetical protein
MNNTFHQLPSRVRTAFVIVAPSAIVVIGVWLVCLAVLMLAANPFQPNLIIMMGGIMAVVTMALVTIVLIARPTSTRQDSDPSSPEL